jgi:hypothetical protein
MSLARFFEEIAPVMLGTVPAAERASALAVDPNRLAIYQRFCRTHRFEAIEGLFPHCQAVVAPSAWPGLVEDYFQRHPMWHVELNANAAQWPEFLAAEAAARSLPSWLSELADFEWWEWQTLIAPDDAADPRVGPLRIAPSLELRPYTRDFIAWIDNDRKGEPAEEATIVLFWRDEALDLRRETASQIELLVLKSLATGEALTRPLLKQLGIRRAAIDETITDLRDAGILHGE